MSVIWVRIEDGDSKGVKKVRTEQWEVAKSQSQHPQWQLARQDVCRYILVYTKEYIQGAWERVRNRQRQREKNSKSTVETRKNNKYLTISVGVLSCSSYLLIYYIQQQPLTSTFPSPTLSFILSLSQTENHTNLCFFSLCCYVIYLENFSIFFHLIFGQFPGKQFLGFVRKTFSQNG